MSISKKPIVVVGSINMDLVARTKQIPLAGQTLTGTGFMTTPGGKGANQAYAVAKLGYPVELVGRVGEDGFGSSMVDHLHEGGVDTSSVERISGPSGVATIVVAETGENCIVVVPGANGQVTPEYVARKAKQIQSAGMVLCQLELPMATIIAVSKLCAEAHVPLMLDPAPAAKIPDEVWSRVTWLTPNEGEAAFYLEDKKLKPEQAAQQLLTRGLTGVVLKRGSQGAYVAVASGQARLIPPFPVKAIDTVGAGDCFNGAFAVALLSGNDPWEAARFASAAAAISVTREGAQASMPTRAEVDQLLST